MSIAIPTTPVTAYDDRVHDTSDFTNIPLLSKNSHFDGSLQGATQTAIGTDESDIFVIDIAGGSRDSAGSLTSSDTLTLTYQVDGPGKMAIEVGQELYSDLALGAGATTQRSYTISGSGTLTLGSGAYWNPPGYPSNDWTFVIAPSAFTAPGSPEYTGTYHLTLSVSGSGGGGGSPSLSDITLFDTTTGRGSSITASVYSGPVAKLQHQYVYTGNDNVNITVTDDNWFLKGGPGEDALQAHGGYNVLDGGTGSNFLTGGSGTDTFFVDDRSPPSDVWSTVNNFHQGDDATVFFGIQPTGPITAQWVDGQGAPGFAGLTLHVLTPNAPTASLTLPGYAGPDLSNGRLDVQFGSEPDGTPFMHIIGIS